MPKILLAAVAVAAVGAYAYSRHQAPNKDAVVTTANNPAAKSAADPKLTNPDAPGADLEKVDWSKVDWRQRLTPEEFHIMREAGTEARFSGEYWNTFNEG